MSRIALLQQQVGLRPRHDPVPGFPTLDTDYEGFCYREASRRGILPEIAAAVCWSEGGLDLPAVRGNFETGDSWWALQLHYGGAGYEHFGYTSGMGNAFTELTGWDPGDPRAWRDAMRYGLDAARAGGWGPWYGAKAQGITGFHSINRNVPWDGTPDDEWDFRHPQAPREMLRAMVLSAVASRIGDPYVWDGASPGGFDCSGVVAWALSLIGFPFTSFTDRMYSELVPAWIPESGDVIFYRYRDANQPGVAYPHMGLWIDPSKTLESRWPSGVNYYTPLDVPYEILRVPGL